MPNFRPPEIEEGPDTNIQLASLTNQTRELHTSIVQNVMDRFQEENPRFRQRQTELHHLVESVAARELRMPAEQYCRSPEQGQSHLEGQSPFQREIKLTQSLEMSTQEAQALHSLVQQELEAPMVSSSKARGSF